MNSVFVRVEFGRGAEIAAQPQHACERETDVPDVRVVRDGDVVVVRVDELLRRPAWGAPYAEVVAAEQVAFFANV